MTPPSPSRLARLSLILGIAAWAVWCVYFVIFGVMVGGGFDAGTGLDAESLGYLVALGGPLAASLFALLLSLAGLLVGVRALLKREPQRGLALAGLVMSLLCLLPYLLMILLLLFAGQGT